MEKPQKNPFETLSLQKRGEKKTREKVTAE
jgi:hypothetical protein